MWTRHEIPIYGGKRLTDVKFLSFLSMDQLHRLLLESVDLYKCNVVVMLMALLLYV